jgi:hypothetical protein
MSTLAVVEQILRETSVPMSVRQIVEHARGRLPTKSRTPDTVVARDLSMDIKKKGEDSLFIRTAPGRYGLREIYLQSQPGQQPDAIAEQTAPESKDAQHAASPPTPMLTATLREERAGPLPARTLAPSQDEQHLSPH